MRTWLAARRVHCLAIDPKRRVYGRFRIPRSICRDEQALRRGIHSPGQAYLCLAAQARAVFDRIHIRNVECGAEGFARSLNKLHDGVAAVGARVTSSALTELADPSHICYGSDWPYVM